jgi:hypothetical protein
MYRVGGEMAGIRTGVTGAGRKKATLPPSSRGQRQGGELGPTRSDWRSRIHEFDPNNRPAAGVGQAVRIGPKLLREAGR